MATKIIMPKLGMAMAEGVIARWDKRDGDQVRKDEEIAVVMSKKITYKLTAPESGILRIVAREKETRPVGASLAFITAPGEALLAVEKAAGPPREPPCTGAHPRRGGDPPRCRPRRPRLQPLPGGLCPGSPAARRLARKKA